MTEGKRTTCINLCATCKYRRSPPRHCALDAPAADKAREGSHVEHCSLYNGRDGLRAVQEAGHGR